MCIDFSAENGRKLPVAAAKARCNALSAITELSLLLEGDNMTDLNDSKTPQPIRLSQTWCNRLKSSSLYKTNALPVFYMA